MAKASGQNGSDCEGRKLGERTGLDTENVKNILGVSSERFVTSTEVRVNDEAKMNILR